MERKNSKRQRLVRFLSAWKTRPRRHAHTPSAIESPPPPLDTQTPEPDTDAHIPPVPETEILPETLVLQAPQEEQRVPTLSQEQLRIWFAGAPEFRVKIDHGHPEPSVSFPWDNTSTKEGVSDSIYLREPAFAATSLHSPLEIFHTPVATGSTYKGYTPNVVEMPNMLSSQGVELGSTGFSYFVGLSASDILDIDSAESQSGMKYLETTRNKELMQINPERIGIRPVALTLIYDRLVELQDLYEAFQDTPEPMTMLNNQSSGDLYANLFGKFLTPPGYDDSTDDPTGLQTQIQALLRILKLRGIWYDFSLVEWRIRLGQILWSDGELFADQEPQPLWTKREILLLQITLSCELLLRLDAFTNIDAIDAESRLQIDPEKLGEFLQKKSRKVDWDLVLARTFLENISVMRANEVGGVTMQSKSRGLFSLLGRGGQTEQPLADIIFLPQHQTRQLSGLRQFAEAIQWPDAVDILQDLASKLGVSNATNEAMQQLSPSSGLLDYNTPSCVSVYGTPLQTPLLPHDALDSYFGNMGQPTLDRHDSQAFRVPLSPSCSVPGGSSLSDLVGGWLSRSYLTGFILPGEAISHFLMSTLLENDKSAISSLGDSANLYGGFTYQQRTWWSKNSIVGRVLAVVEGSTECMGWISCPKLPSGLAGWHNIQSEQVPQDRRLCVTADVDVVARDSAMIPETSFASVTSQDFVLPSDPEVPSTPVLSFSRWELTPINPDLIDNDISSGPLIENDIQAASLTFSSRDQTLSHNLTLAYDAQFVTSWPCSTSASAAPAVGLPYILKRSRAGTLSRSSSKHSVTFSLRSNHGFEPLLSHPPASSTIAPKRMYEAGTEDEAETFSPHNLIPHGKPLTSHPLHKSYLYKIVPVTRILEPDFELPFEMHTSKSTDHLLSLANGQDSAADTIANTKKTVLVLDARGSTDMALLARAWCAEKGLHAIIGRSTRTCMACCIREARGLNMKIVIRV